MMVLRLSLLAMLFIGLVLVAQPASAQKKNRAADIEILKDIVTGKGYSGPRKLDHQLSYSGGLGQG